MIDRTLLSPLAGWILFGGLIALEIGSALADKPVIAPASELIEASPLPHTPPPQNDDPLATVLARPLFSATRRPGEQDKPTASNDPELSDLRLTGIVIEPSRRLAIFTTPTGKTLIRLEGENLRNWRVDGIASHAISLSSSAETRTWALKPDPNLVRPAPPVAAAPTQAGERLPPRRNRHKIGSG